MDVDLLPVRGKSQLWRDLDRVLAIVTYRGGGRGGGGGVDSSIKMVEDKIEDSRFVFWARCPFLARMIR